MGTIRRAGLLMLAAVPLVAFGANAPEPYILHGAAWVSVDAAGHARVEAMEHVREFEGHAALAPVEAKVQQALRQRIEAWEFVPAMRDGVAVPSRTHVAVQLEGVDDGAGGMRLLVRTASTGGVAANLRPPKYPVEARFVEGARVVVAIEFDETGKVRTAEVTEAKAFRRGKPETGPKGVMAKLAKATVEAARAWTYTNEIVDGRPIAARLVVPVTFCTSRCDLMQALLEEERHVAEAIGTGEPIALDPAVRLRSAVAGTAL